MIADYLLLEFIRLLAYAGFDARAAIKFWEERDALDTCAETQKKPKQVTEEHGQTQGQSQDPNQRSDGFWTQLDNFIPISSISWPSWLSNNSNSEGAGTWFTRTGMMHDQGSHPISAERVKRLRAELDRWEQERVKYVKSLERAEPTPA